MRWIWALILGGAFLPANFLAARLISNQGLGLTVGLQLVLIWSSFITALYLSWKEHSNSSQDSLIELIKTQKKDLQEKEKKIQFLSEELSACTREEKLQTSFTLRDVFAGCGEKSSQESLYESLPCSLEAILLTPYDAFLCLRKHMQFTEDFRGATLSSRSHESKAFVKKSSVIDLRRLFEGLKEEEKGIVIFYSQEEGGLLFASPKVRSFLGWSPQRFIDNFPSLLEKEEDWKKSLRDLQLPHAQKEQLSLKLRKRNRELVLFHACLGKISKGAFAGNILGILYPA